MEESDFSIRNEIDSLTSGHNSELQELISRYKHPESSSTPVKEKIILSESGSLKNAILALLSRKDKNDNTFSGLQFSIGSQILQWIVLLLFAVLVIWLILKYTQHQAQSPNRKRKNPFKKVRALEKKVQRLERTLTLNEEGEDDETLTSTDESDMDGLPF